MAARDGGLRQALTEARTHRRRDDLARTLIRLGAPRELLAGLFRTSTRRFARERRRLGIEGPRGRPVTLLLDNATEERIWHL